MGPLTTTSKKKMKENARKAAQKKVKKEAAKKMVPSPSSMPNQSAASHAATPASIIPPSYLSTFSASTIPAPTPFSATNLPAALLAEPISSDDPGWLQSKKIAWDQAQKTVCIRWVREKREKVARAEKALAAGRGSEEEVHEAMIELSEEIEDAINRGCVMEELQ